MPFEIPYDIPYIWNLKRNDTNKFTYRTEIDSQIHLENELMVALGGRMGKRDRQGVWDGHVHIATFKMDNQQRALYSIWNSAQRYVAAWMGGEFGGEWTHVYDG